MRKKVKKIIIKELNDNFIINNIIQVTIEDDLSFSFERKNIIETYLKIKEIINKYYEKNNINDIHVYDYFNGIKQRFEKEIEIIIFLRTEKINKIKNNNKNDNN